MNQRLGLEHNKKNVGKLLRLYRQHANYKSEHIAKELSISIANYSKLENGQIELTDSRLTLVCKVYEITPPEFYLHFRY
ncbi:MAG: Helix-turn-helix domain [Segetibacter sp.]|nr:Helix-turn-helix domain [Segetibacter sp.]